MSSEDSSDQRDSRNAFDDDSLGPSSPVREQSLAVSWMESSQNSPALQSHEVAGGEQSDGGASSSGNEQWNCTDLISMISLREAKRSPQSMALRSRPHKRLGGRIILLLAT